MKKVVLAFSGGLDTSYCAIYLAKEMGLEVHAALANTGGFSAEELARIEKRAYALGVKSYVALDVTQDYYQHAIKYMIFGNVLKNSTYPISVSSERISQATAIARYAREIGADYLCHGSTGAGNDQVRFDMIFNIVAPGNRSDRVNPREAPEPRGGNRVPAQSRSRFRFQEGRILDQSGYLGYARLKAMARKG